MALEETHDKAQIRALIASISGPNADVHGVAMVVRTLLEAALRKAKEPPPPPTGATGAAGAAPPVKAEEDDDNGSSKLKTRR